MASQQDFSHISSTDYVALALRDAHKGEKIVFDDVTVTLLEDIPFGHKVALRDIKAGEDVIKYDYPIGHATQDIKAGQHVHLHNLKSNLGGAAEYKYKPIPLPEIKKEEAFFEGYVRPDGKVGTRNEIWIIPTVGCVNMVCDKLMRLAKEKYGDRCGFTAMSHHFGCTDRDDDYINNQKIIVNLAKHPNAAATLMVSLGCENNNIETFQKALGDYDDERIKFLITQDVEDEIAVGMEILDKLSQYVATQKRQTVSASELILGLKCGGSDAFSGIIANPLVGRFCDKLVACGGTGMITETPEMFGAETLLMARAKDVNVFNDIVKMINDFKHYYERWGVAYYENPSAGNNKGGITTLEEKSLGCITKSGSTAITEVIPYAGLSTKKGASLVAGPAYDLLALTNMISAGAQVTIFTTGRGNPFGSVVPNIRVASNSVMGKRKQNWIDFNAGLIMEGMPIEEATEKLFQMVLDVASGRMETLTEINGYKEIVLFKDGITV